MARDLSPQSKAGGGGLAACLRLFVVAIALTAGAVVVAHASAQPAAQRLVVDVGSSVSIKTSTGGAVKTLRPGAYLVVIHDRSRVANFHLTAGSPHWLDRATGRRFVGTVTWRLQFRPDNYVYLSDARPRRVQHFRVD